MNPDADPQGDDGAQGNCKTGAGCHPTDVLDAEEKAVVMFLNPMDLTLKPIP